MNKNILIASMHSLLTALIAATLSLGFLPSFTALSQGISSSAPQIARFMGPLNFLKLASPFLIVYCWQQRERISPMLRWLTALVLSAGTLFTLIAIQPCPSAAPVLREWSVFALGWLGALTFFCLSDKERLTVSTTWMVCLFGSAFIDLAIPDLNTWLLNHIFDPNTRAGDFAEVGHRVLTGVFGRQSLAKLLAWLPWFWLFVMLRAPLSSNTRKKLSIVAGALLIVSVPAILGTSQRGPFAAALAAIGTFGLHQAIQLKKKKALLAAMAMLLVTIGLTFTLVPRKIWEPRLRSLVGMHSETDNQYSREEQTAEGNKDVRIQMNRFSLHVIAHHPFGHACIPYVEFQAAHVIGAHAHNLFLEQYRSKGWIWGTIHLALWVMALACAWRLRSTAGSALFAGIISVVVSGLTDHPWFVLNHALILAAFIILAIGPTTESSKKESSGKTEA